MMRPARAHLALAVLLVVAVTLASCGGHANAGKPSPRPSYTSGVFGIVLAPEKTMVTIAESRSPLPGGFGPRDGSQPASNTSVQVLAKTGAATGKVVTTVTSDAQGLFHVNLMPGTYVLKPVQRNRPRLRTTVKVRAGHCARVIVSFAF